jgi:hypothetical protein
MHARRVYIMQDQVHDRVSSIMACDIRHPDHRRRRLSRQFLLSLVVAAAYLVTLAV